MTPAKVFTQQNTEQPATQRCLISYECDKVKKKDHRLIRATAAI